MGSATEENRTKNDNQTLIAFWDQVFTLKDEERTSILHGEKDAWKEMAPSEKLFLAAGSLGKCKKVLDYGCGSAWAGIIAAKSGCMDVTAADVAKGAADSAALYAQQFSVEKQLKSLFVAPDWLSSVPAETYDGVFCSNVLDVVPEETALGILQEMARITTKDASVIIGLNYYLSPEAAAQRGIELVNGRSVYMNGVLRLVSRSDEEWETFFSPWFTVAKLQHFAWPNEQEERRRLFYLRKNSSLNSIPC